MTIYKNRSLGKLLFYILICIIFINSLYSIDTIVGVRTGMKVHGVERDNHGIIIN